MPSGNRAQCDSLVTDEIASWDPSTGVDALCALVKAQDAAFSARVEEAAAEGKSLVHRCCVNVEKGTTSIGFVPLPSTDRMTRCIDSENLIMITSARYSPNPLVIQGPGAGAEITASGLFADLLGLSRTLVEWTIPKIE